MCGVEPSTVTILGVSVATTLSGGGLLLDIAGGWLMSYDLLFGYRKRNRLEIVETQLNGYRLFFADVERIIDGYGGSFTPADRNKEKAALQAQYKPNVDKLEEEKAKLTAGHADTTFGLGAVGMVLLLVGFSIQFVALFF